MIKEDGKVRVQQERWQDYFMVEVDGKVARYMEGSVEALPWYLVPTEFSMRKDTMRYWAFYLVPIIWVKAGVIWAWFYPARLIFQHKRPWLELPPEGQSEHWFWPQYLKVVKYLWNRKARK